MDTRATEHTDSLVMLNLRKAPTLCRSLAPSLFSLSTISPIFRLLDYINQLNISYPTFYLYVLESLKETISYREYITVLSDVQYKKRLCGAAWL